MSDEALLRAAQKHCSVHRAEVLASGVCGCFHCLELFAPSSIVKWADVDGEGIGQTALCPRCGVDAVIGDRAGVPLDKKFLKRLHGECF